MMLSVQTRLTCPEDLGSARLAKFRFFSNLAYPGRSVLFKRTLQTEGSGLVGFGKTLIFSKSSKFWLTRFVGLD